MSSWHGYPKVYNLGHPQIADLFTREVVIQEKIDGSQFSFGKHDGKLRVRSRGREFIPEAADDMFRCAVDNVVKVFDNLPEGATYRGEYLRRPKHNCLAYDRVPANNIAIFDIEVAESNFLPPQAVANEAQKLGFESIATFRVCPGSAIDREYVIQMMESISALGGQKIEGLVFKNYQEFTRDGKVMIGKHVSEAFKETHRTDWKERHPTQGDLVQVMINKYRTPARWGKAVQHLREAGTLLGEPADIGPLVKELHRDLREEAFEEIAQILMKKVWGDIAKGVCRGMPEWYKDQLMEGQFHV